MKITQDSFHITARQLWLTSIRLHKSGHPKLARAVKYLNALLYRNSLPPEATVSPDIKLGHQGLGTIVHPKVVIGRNVTIMHNVTISMRPPTNTNSIVIEDGVTIGANAVLMTPRNRGLRIGRRSRVGAGAVVTHDVPPETLALSVPAELRPRNPDVVDPEDADEDAGA